MGKPLRVKLSILDASGSALPNGQLGEVALAHHATRCASQLFDGYEADQSTHAVLATAPKARGAVQLEGASSGAFRTGDIGWLDEDEWLYLTGRAKEVINRGGELLSPAA